MKIGGILSWKEKTKKLKVKETENGTIYFSETLQKWVAQYVEPNGKRKTITQKKNEKVSDFKKRFSNIINEINNNTYITSTDTSLYNILKDYIDNNFKTGITNANAYKRNLENLKLLEKCCSNYIYKPLQKVTVKDVRTSLSNFVEFEYTNSKTSKTVIKTYSQTVIDKLYRFLNKGFKIGISERIIQYNIMENETIQKPKSKRASDSVEALTIEEEKSLINILQNTKHKYNNIILLTLFTGMRIGETLALSNTNIDLKNNTLTVEKTLTRNTDDKVILGDTTKTRAGKRTIYLSNNAIKTLKIILSEKITNIYNLVFWDYDKNTFITPNEINCYLKRINEKYNICSTIHTHMLRHTFATRCIEAGMSAKVLQKNLGHKKIQTTLDTYTSVFEKFNKDENEKYNEYMKQNGL